MGNEDRWELKVFEKELKEAYSEYSAEKLIILKVNLLWENAHEIPDCLVSCKISLLGVIELLKEVVAHNHQTFRKKIKISMLKDNIRTESVDIPEDGVFNHEHGNWKNFILVPLDNHRDYVICEVEKLC
ncbi:hypothetical protein COEREDRAFT_89873 [Coemansia reversa NRRL 1564]|uniref:Uncharacterized protein n=1 Tax=Coemansia reversa (strain ATCC 12441 / NRRL 1564) TaxID=763665 RepID=A0A2G5B1Y6_COERN|nr:hypothetical protein COEREDRAFT_89873 [Coemansia reversa NRRL 1564]|eukprot:PIA13028.1 hypothetical protein COEREDRAFT_89873 [Coemansia reversa NRRL 1564]